MVGLALILFGATQTGFAAAPEPRVALSTFKECDDCPEMVVIPGGEFMMGSPSYEEGRSDDEGPQHRVTIRQPFAVGKYEIMFREWDACVADGGCNGYRPDDRGWGRGNRPVIRVTWTDAQAYLRWLSGKSGAEYRLLSEAEWEYVARAGTTTPFHYGSTISTDQANYDGSYTYGSGGKGVSRKKTVPVGSFPSNAFGLHDVHGNVREWVEDCWNGSYARTPIAGAVWTSGDCNVRVLRGGSWFHSPRDARTANRYGDGTVSRSYGYGFRAARTLQ
jgi:formylglycine-generating enzyme required for sulfatase activity